MRRLFDGETGAIRDNVVLNTAAALVICDKVNSLKEGIKLLKIKLILELLKRNSILYQANI